jgi:hypothetical protein
VETGNSWQTGEADSTALNRATLEGMVKYFKNTTVGVGIYSTSHQWGIIAGTVSSSSPLAGLPSWLAGAKTLRRAKSNCSLPGLTPGSTVTVTQYVSVGLDYDYSCILAKTPLLPAPQRCHAFCRIEEWVGVARVTLELKLVAWLMSEICYSDSDFVQAEVTFTRWFTHGPETSALGTLDRWKACPYEPLHPVVLAEVQNRSVEPGLEVVAHHDGDGLGGIGC